MHFPILNRLLLTIGCLSICTWAIGQFAFGVKAGLSTSPLENLERTLRMDSIGNQLILKLQDVNPGFHGGPLVQYKANVFVLQAELLFDYYSATFSVDSVNGAGELISRTLDSGTEHYFSTMIPVLINLKLGPVRVGGGPKGILYIGGGSDLKDLPFYSTNFSTFSLGWEAGFGLDVWKLMFDIRFEGRGNEFGYHQQFFGESGDFSRPYRRFLFQLGYRF